MRRLKLITAFVFFSIPIYCLAQKADTTNLNALYSSKLKEFKKGKKDKTFLKSLISLAQKQKDSVNIDKINSAYVSQIRQPYSAEDLKFLQESTTGNKDVIFNFIIAHASSIIPIPYEGEMVLDKAKGIIYSEVHPEIFNKDVKPNLKTIEHEAIYKYSTLGELVVLQEIALYYYLAKNMPNFVLTKERIHNKFPLTISIFDMNNDAWAVFQNSSDSSLLKTALNWSKEVIKKEPTANYYDTYANLLYKLGRKEEAIKIEEKGQEMPTGNIAIPQSLEENLNKMRQGQPTWNVPASEGN
jgi:hypothetical protein